ncbi:MAG: glycosyltransferase family 39 protein [Planctomycetes bacterium]|nr:glycosyltransferase family 39 protein [Planctomycetota bacterium]
MSARAIAVRTALLFLLIYLIPLALRPIISPDESRYGAIALEMLHSKDWWTLKLLGLRYYEKPPLGYWLTAASMSLFGENAWALRLPAALAALATAVATGRIAARVSTLPGIGGAACLVQLTLIFPWVFGSVAILDGVFTAFVTVCVALFVHAATEARARRRLGFLALSGVAAAAAFLTKGFLGLAIPALIAGGWLLWQRRIRDLLLLPIVPILAAAAVAAPLILVLHQRNPGFWNYFFWVEHVRRFTAPDGNQHPESWWFFLPLIPLGALLWSLNIEKIAKGFRRSLFHSHGLSLCAAWILLPLLLLSASSGKLPSYILPVFPPVAILIAASLLQYLSIATRRTWWMDRAGQWMLVAAALLSATLIMTGHRWIYAEPLWHGDERTRFGVLALALLAWAALDRWTQRAKDPAWRLTRMAFSPAPLFMVIPLLFPVAMVERSRTAVESLRGPSAEIARAATILSDCSVATSVAYTTGRFDMTLIGPPGELDNELKLPEEKARFIARDAMMGRIAQAQARGPVALILTNNDLKAFHEPGAPRPQSEFRDADISVALFPAAK